MTTWRASALAAALALVAVGAPPAAADPPSAPLPQCATPVGPDQLSAGQPAVAFTVRRGEAVERFDVEILGVMRDGLGPGRDMVVIDADAEAPVIREGGISAGMSGSPVYTHDGRLIGAIGYAFALGSSPIGGVTPAPDMLRLLLEPERGSDAEPAQVRLRGPVRRRARQAGAEPAALAAGLRRLPLPLAVSGLRPERAATLRTAAERRELPLILTGGGRPAPLATSEPTAGVAPGDSFAAVLSYGDATFSAIGTATYACDGGVLAFGHPFLFSGSTLLGASRASVLGIVDDALIPYKLASVTAPIGIVDLDRLAALRGLSGRMIPTLSVTQDTIALDTGERRPASRTEIVRAPGDARLFLPDIAVTHAFSNIDVTFDQISGGSSFVSWRLRGTRTRDGQPWRLRRSNRFASNWDISLASVIEMWSDLLSVTAQRLEPIELAGLRVRIRVGEAIRRYRIADVAWATPGKQFRRTPLLRVRPGQRIRARIQLRDPLDGAMRRVGMRFRAPGRPGPGAIRISGGARLAQGGDLLVDDSEAPDFFACASGAPCTERTPQARSFSRLLDRLQGRPRNDELVGRARFRGTDRRVVRQVNRVVAGRAAVRVIVRRRR